MTALHAATSTPLTQELAADMHAEFVHWLELWASSLAAEHRTTTDVVSSCCLHVIEEAIAHVQIRFAATLATHGV